MTLIGLPFIDRVGRRRLLLIGAAGMCICEFIVAIVGVTAGNIQPDGSVNLAAQRVLIAFVCMCVFLPPLFCKTSLLTFYVQLYRLLRCLLGSHRLGCHRRSLPAFYPWRRNVALYRQQLALELWHWLRHALPCQPYHVRRQWGEGC